MIFQKCFPHKGVWRLKGVLFFRIFLAGHISDANRFSESFKSLDFLLFASIPGIFIFLGFDILVDVILM